MSNDVIDLIENTFVDARQADPTLSADDFHRWLLVARLLAISYGSSTITEGHFNRSKEMDLLRKQYLIGDEIKN
jgi:hypothetical protein